MACPAFSLRSPVGRADKSRMTDLLLPGLPVVDTPRLTLRPCSLADAEPFQALTNDPAIADSVDFLTLPFTLADAERLIVGRGDGKDCFWGVWLDRRMVGTVGTHLRGPEEIEIGYWLSQAARGQGFASEAVAAVLAALAVAYPKRLIVAECRPENVASWRLLERAGFCPDGSDGLRAGRKRLVLSAGRRAGGSRPSSG
jgi:RimJ/RimL family protein N-acetyltransferase